MKKILLIGNPNVGKSAVFSRLTGARVSISNYPGTTVGFTQGIMKLGEGKKAAILDVPGIYNLHPTNKAEEVAKEMLRDGDIVINVVDATNLERNLYLTLQLRESGVPVVLVLNMWDETKHRGVEIDADALSEQLGLPVVTTCALTGEGIKHLSESLGSLEKKDFEVLSKEKKWELIGDILDKCQRLHHHHHTLLQRFEDFSMHPTGGFIVAGAVVYVSFMTIRLVAESLIDRVFEPLFDTIWLPLMSRMSSFLGGTGFIHNVLVGQLIEGRVDFGQSFGMLTTGLFVPIAAVFPYLFSFYLVLGILEDFGYLPRLATQVDNLFHKLGLHGYAIVPMILGLGCNVPGALSLRLLESRREKFIAATMMAVAVPCVAQIAMIVGLVGERGGKYVALIFGILFLLIIFKGLIMNRLMKGASPEIMWEIPPYRLPQPMAVFKKLSMRVTGFLKEALPYVLLGVLIVNLLYFLGIFNFFANIFAPLLTGLWGIPEETIGALLIGFLRKDVAIGMLAPLGLTTKQLVISCTILAVYFPCMATFVVMVKELGGKDMLKGAVIMVSIAISLGALMNFVW